MVLDLPGRTDTLPGHKGEAETLVKTCNASMLVSKKAIPGRVGPQAHLRVVSATMPGASGWV